MCSMKDYITRLEDMGYTEEDISVSLSSTTSQWNAYLRENPDKQYLQGSKTRVTKREKNQYYEPFEGDDGRMSYIDDSGKKHKQYIDEDDMENDPDCY